MREYTGVRAIPNEPQLLSSSCTILRTINFVRFVLVYTGLDQRVRFLGEDDKRMITLDRGVMITLKCRAFKKENVKESRNMSDHSAIPAHVPPGNILKTELQARGWSSETLAEIINKPPHMVKGIIEAQKHITPDTAIRLAQAFDTKPEFWHILESNYRLHLARRQISAAQLSQVRRKSRLYTLAPVDELLNRGWIDRTTNLDDLEDAVCAFLGIRTPQETPSLANRLSASQKLTPEITAQIAWLRRVEHLVWHQSERDFAQERFAAAIPELLKLANRVEDIVHVPDKLSEMGIHFVIVPVLPHTFIAGATFEQRGRQIIALTLAEPEIDAFWFRLMHQLAHIVLGHTGVHLSDTREDHHDTDAANNEATHVAASRWATEQLFPPAKYQAFVAAHNGQFKPHQHQNLRR